jgi:hypothetical protein
VSATSLLPRLHSHPTLERKLGVPEGHAIIDSEAFLLLREIHGMGPIRRKPDVPRDRRGVNVGEWIDAN